MKIYGFLISIVLAAVAIKESAAQYEANIYLYGFKDKFDEPFVVNLDNDTIEDYGCTPTMNVSIIVHGWLEGLSPTAWVNETITNFLKYRKGCVFFFDYSKYSKHGDYFGGLVPHYYGIAPVLTKYLLLIGHPERIFMYGFSFGARLTVEAAIAAFNGSIDRIDLCEPAGPAFDGTPAAKVPTLAAQNVACIDTSTNYGTPVYNCHQNFRMGACGTAQAAHSSYPKGSHGLCPYFYNVAFDFDFIPYDHYAYQCSTARPAKLTPEVKMGFLGISYINKTEIRGDIFIATSGHWPYIAVDPRHVYFNLTKISQMMIDFENLQFTKREDFDDAAMVVMRNKIWWTSFHLLKALQEFTKDLAASAPYKLQSNELFSYENQNSPKLETFDEFEDDYNNLFERKAEAIEDVPMIE